MTIVAKLRQKAAILLEEVAVSLGGVWQTDEFRPLFETFFKQLTKDRQSVKDGDIHRAEQWNQDNLKLLEDRVDIGGAVKSACEKGEGGILRDELSCISGFRQAQALLRHAKLVHRVLIRSDQHIPDLTESYTDLEEK